MAANVLGWRKKQAVSIVDVKEGRSGDGLEGPKVRFFA
jgi:hypothetical protein